LIYIELFHIFFFQSWCKCGIRFHTFFHSFSFLYCFHFSYIKKRTKNLLTPIPVSILLFVNDRLFVSQKKSYKKSNASLFCSYSIISSLFNQSRLVIKHNKSEVFHFSRSTKNNNLPPLDLKPLRGPLLKPKDMWRYLGFFFNKKLSFHQNIHYYANKVLSMIKGMKILENSTRGLSTTHKWLLYRIYSSNHFIQISALVLQKSATISAS